MLIHGDTYQSDPRVMCGIMARAALERLEMNEVEIEQVRNAYFYNFIRILEMYRYEAFQDYNVEGVLQREEESSIEPIRDINKNHLADVATAITNAHNAVYPGYSKEQLVGHLRQLLDQIREAGTNGIDAQELTNLRNFLQQIEENLEI